MMIVAMFGFAGLVFADSGTPVKHIGPGARVAKDLAAGDLDPANNAPALVSAALAAPPANDTCAGAVPLTLNLVTKGTTLGANDDYQTPATTSCYAGIGQTPTTAPGRDVVYSFTAPAAGKYTIEIIQQAPGDAIRTQNEVLYQTDCANSGTVNCIKGINRPQSAAFSTSTGSSNNQSEALDCIPMTSGQTVYVVFDDASPGKCSNNNHACFADSDCATGATCVPSLNAGGAMSLEVRPCNPEVEPNDTPAQATPLVCGMIGESTAAPAAHCYLGTRAGRVCTRSGFLEQTLPNSNMRCSISNAQCIVDLATGIGNCALPGELCQQQTDLDCDPRCDVGPNAGKTCTTQAFCNPVSDQGATCAGTCQIESRCIINATNADTGIACTPVCVGGLFPGRYCSALSGCPGGGVCTTTPAVVTPGNTCATTGQTCSRIYNEGDDDFYSLGVVPVGNAIFAGVDAKASNDYDFRMRVTNDTQTLQFDDDDVTSRGGSNAPTIAGALGDGTPAYVKVSRTQPRQSSTYELYAHVRPPLAAAQLEDENVSPTGNDNYFLWPGDLLACNPVTAGGYVRGTFAYNQDTDCFKFLVNKGDLMDWFGAANPQRTAGGTSLVDIPQPLVYDAEPAGISNTGFGANARKNTTANVQQPSLNALSPAVTSSYFQWRASYTGMLEVCYFAASQFLSQGAPSYPNNWSGSMTVNCGPVQNAGPGTTTADVAVTKTGPVGPVATGDFVDYTITMTNNGTEIAQEVSFDDTLDANLTFIGLTVDDTLGGNNVACYSLPTAGLNDAPINCINASMAPGSTTTYVLTVQVNNCIGDGVTIANTATITTVSTDPDPSNDSATANFTTVAAANNGCTDIVCNSGVCIANLCTANDQCVAGACQSGAPPNCNDNSLCTDDSCSSAVGCINDSSQAGDLCDDFNACTDNACDPTLFCVFPPKSSSTTCDDGLTCTLSDHCDGAGTCGGLSVCDDANACTDDFADETNACACSHAPSAGGSACNDNNACTGTVAAQDACDGAGLCVGGQPVVCDDSNACTTDTCDPALGCIYTPIVCDDGNACNGVETCSTATGCVAGTPLACNDGDACNGVETCDPSSGCVGGTPVVCTASDQCHVAGTCAPGTGLCSNPNAPDGTTCNDGDATTSPDACQTGVCVGTPLCSGQPKPKSSGYYKKLCKGGHGKPSSTDALTAADAACVGQLTTTFAGISTVDDICAVYNQDSSNHDTNGPDCKDCQKGEQELMALALNICRQRVCQTQEVDSACGADHDSHHRVLTTVGASLHTADSLLSNPARTKAQCKDATCLAKEINNGKGIHHVSLMLAKEVGNKTRLNWASPVMDDGSGEASKYTIWRRALNADAVYVKITETTALTYVDNNAGTGNWEYEVTFTIQP